MGQLSGLLRSTLAGATALGYVDWRLVQASLAVETDFRTLVCL